MTMALHVRTMMVPARTLSARTGGGAVALAIVRNGAEPDLLQRQARLDAVEGLDLRYDPTEVGSDAGKGGVRAREHLDGPWISRSAIMGR
jgi:hypothetical protein